MARIVNLRQGSPDWVIWRQGGLGGSDAAAVMGENAFASPEDLARDKLTGAKKAMTPAMKRGLELEPKARRLYQELTGIIVRPVCVMHEKHDWLRASLDGMSDDGETIIEIKCPFSPRGHKIALRGRVPEYHRAQIQHSLLASGARRCHFVSYYPDMECPADQIAIVPVYPDPAYHAALLRAEAEFVEALRAARADCPAPGPDDPAAEMA